MNPRHIGMIVIAFTLGGALIGIWLQSALPRDHLNEDSRFTVKLGIGLVSTITALVLGLVTASAKSSFDALDTAVKHTANDILALDRLLARYGSETSEIRVALQHVVAGRIEMLSPQGSSRLPGLAPSLAASTVEGLANAIRDLAPRDESERSLQSRALDLAEALLQARWLVFAGGGASIPLPFLVVILFWLTVTFVSFGLFAPRNATVLAVLFMCAVSVGSAVFLILEMDEPFHGLVKVSVGPLLYAHAHLNQ